MYQKRRTLKAKVEKTQTNTHSPEGPALDPCSPCGSFKIQAWAEDMAYSQIQAGNKTLQVSKNPFKTRKIEPVR